MNRFDRSFHAVDQLTGRPFSFGHPDGVWIVTIIYMLIVVVAVVGALIATIMAKFAGLSPAVAISAAGSAVITTVLYVPPVVLLFRRAKLVVTWMLMLAVLSVVGAAMIGFVLYHADQLDTPKLAGLTVGVVMQGYITYYTAQLKQDSLLT